MACREFGGPYFHIAAGRGGCFPHVGNVQRMADDAGAHFITKKALQQIFVQRERILGKHRISALLEFLQDAVVQAGIMVIGPRQHYESQLIFPL